MTGLGKKGRPSKSVRINSVKLIVARDDRLPSKVKDAPWVYAFAPGAQQEVDLDATSTKVGKWLLYIPTAHCPIGAQLVGLRL